MKEIFKKIKKTKSIFAREELLEIFFARPRTLNCLIGCTMVQNNGSCSVEEVYEHVDEVEENSPFSFDGFAKETILTYDESGGNLYTVSTVIWGGVYIHYILKAKGKFKKIKDLHRYMKQKINLEARNAKTLHRVLMSEGLFSENPKRSMKAINSTFYSPH